MSNQRTPPQPIHKALRLQSTYIMRKSVVGWIGNNHFQLRMMASPTGGTITIWAMSKSWGPWESITREQFIDLAQKILA